MAETPSIAADAATQTGVLPRSETVLLGTVTGPAGNMALMRTAGGGLLRLSVGDRLDGAIVVAIDDGQLVQSRNGQTRVYKMPQG